MPQLSSPTSCVVAINVATCFKNHLAAEAGVTQRALVRTLTTVAAVKLVGKWCIVLLLLSLTECSLSLSLRRDACVPGVVA